VPRLFELLAPRDLGSGISLTYEKIQYTLM